MWTRLKKAVPNFRGHSFTFDVQGEENCIVQDLSTTKCPSTMTPEQLMNNPSMCRDPSMPYVLPSRKDGDERKYTVVLDLDETLVYGREGPLFTRPGLAELLEFLSKTCETVVWTAGEREYAKRIIRNIDPKGVIEHCIYRHPKWFNGASHWKDLSLCGRDMDHVILIDNTPDCIRGQAIRAVLVSDFWGGDGAGDTTLPVIQKLVSHLVSSGMSVREYLPKSPLVSSRFITSKNGNEMYLYCLDVDKAEQLVLESDAACLATSPGTGSQAVKDLADSESPVRNVSFISMPPP